MALGIRSAFAHVDCGVLVVDDGRVALANASLRQLFGLSADHPWEGRPCTELVETLAAEVADGPAFRARLEELSGTREPVNEDVVMADGRVLEREYLPVAVDGAPAGQVSLYWDVTDSRSADRERLRRQRAEVVAQQMGVHAQRTRADEAEHAGRSLAEQVRLLAATDAHRKELLATASHELRTPLTSILGFSEILTGDVEGVDTRQYAEIINRNARSLLRVVDDLLLLASIDSSAQELAAAAVDVEELLEHGAQSLAGLAETCGVSVRVRVAGAPAVRGDGDGLDRVVSNVLGNAIKYSDRGGEVDVTALRDGDAVRIDVRDRGIGIPEAELQQVFSQFYRASTARESGRQGTGLGLAIAQSIVTQHGGTITLTSAVGQGTTTTIRLPSESSSRSV